VWLKVTVSVALLAAAAWWVLDRSDRTGNERRLSDVASQIAGRAVEVHCPGPVARVLGGSTAEGWVEFDAAGQPADQTKLQKTSCAELDALAEGRRAKELECTARAGILCGRRGTEVAMAVDVVTHEAFHMSGIRDEAATECASLSRMGDDRAAARGDAGAGRRARARAVRRDLSADGRGLPQPELQGTNLAIGVSRLR
jgi:hypothetical protein